MTRPGSKSIFPSIGLAKFNELRASSDLAVPYWQYIFTWEHPHGTILEVPDPDEAGDYLQRGYRIVLRSTMSPINVYLVNQFEEKFVKMNGIRR